MVNSILKGLQKIPIDRERFRFYLRVGAVWLLLWLFNSVINHTETFLVQSVNEIWRAIYIIGLNYLFFEYTLPSISKKRILRSILISSLQIVLFSFGMYAWKHLGIQLHIYTILKSYASFSVEVAEHFGVSVFSVLFFGIIKHFYNYVQLKQVTQQLRIEKQQAELHYLKAQTNPHFLFNTLHNIYSLARDKSDLAPESILRLSKILRFMLYETVGEYITIEQELNIIDDYIDLEKLRYDDSLRVDRKYDIDDMKQALPPLLLIPIVENAFKHGVSETRHAPFIDIRITVIKQQLKLVVRNSVESVTDELKVKENIGLTNLRRQLELLYLDYDLSLQRGETVFTATLNINLASHV